MWSKVVRGGRFVLDLVKRLDPAGTGRDEKATSMASVTSILPLAQVVYTGDDDGRVVSGALKPGRPC